jgi:hypothetical protein
MVDAVQCDLVPGCDSVRQQLRVAARAGQENEEGGSRLVVGKNVEHGIGPAWFGTIVIGEHDVRALGMRIDSENHRSWPAGVDALHCSLHGPNLARFATIRGASPLSPAAAVARWENSFRHDAVMMVNPAMAMASAQCPGLGAQDLLAALCCLL